LFHRAKETGVEQAKRQERSHVTIDAHKADRRRRRVVDVLPRKECGREDHATAATTTVSKDPTAVSIFPQSMSFSCMPLSTTALC
jgi:hypothetical protein